MRMVCQLEAHTMSHKNLKNLSNHDKYNQIIGPKGFFNKGYVYRY